MSSQSNGEREHGNNAGCYRGSQDIRDQKVSRKAELLKPKLPRQSRRLTIQRTTSYPIPPIRSSELLMMWPTRKQLSVI